MAFDLDENRQYEVTFTGIADGQAIQNVLHYVPTGGLTLGSTTALEKLHDLWTAQMMPLLNAKYALESVEMKRITGVTGGTPSTYRLTYDAVDIVFADVGENGEVDEPPLPSFVTANTRKLTVGGTDTLYYPVDPPSALSERVFRGRVALGVLSETQSVDTSSIYLLEAVRADVETAWEAFMLPEITPDPDGVDLSLIVISEQRAGVIRQGIGGVNILAFQAVAGMRTNAYMGSQVSRKYRGIGS